MRTHRLRAPSGDGDLFALPPLDQAEQSWRSNLELLENWNHDFQGRSAGFLRAAAAREALESAKIYHASAGIPMPPELEAAPGPRRIVATGHQPELFHPGVWVKNFAVNHLARRFGATPLNLIVDNDLPKSLAVRVPRLEGRTSGVQTIEFDSGGLDVPFEDLVLHDPELFNTFGDRVSTALNGAIENPLVHDYWPLAAEYGGQRPRIGLMFSRARRLIEQSWGVSNWEVPLSAICESESFLWMTCHILAHLPRYRFIHNDCLNEYRLLHRIRSKNHPVADLGQEGDWLEAPFWAWRKQSPRRRPLLARQLKDTIELRMGGEDRAFAELPLGPEREACCAVERLKALPPEGVRLRSRALTTTMYSRLILSGQFVHGIGGAKYDELGDEIIRRFLETPPPEYLTLSMTLWIGIDGGNFRSSDLERVDRQRAT